MPRYVLMDIEYLLCVTQGGERWGGNKSTPPLDIGDYHD